MNIELAIASAELASKEILEVYRGDDFQTERKDDKSPLTIADKRAHAVIEKTLQTSGLPILSEEGKDIPYDERKHWERFWMVDPLDGTKEFLKRNDEFTVNIALIEQGVPVLGVIAVPVTGDVYYATKGGGAFMKHGTAVRPLTKREPVDLKKSGLRVVASRSHMSPETEAFISQLIDPHIVSAGSSLKFMMLATGAADIYPRFAPTMEWDTAAGQAILNEVGAKVLTKLGGEEFRYNRKELRNGWFVAV